MNAVIRMLFVAFVAVGTALATSGASASTSRYELESQYHGNTPTR